MGTFIDNSEAIFFPPQNNSNTEMNEETHGRISHQEIRSKCEQHDCISVKMLFKLNDQINFENNVVALGEMNEHIEMHSGKLKVA